MGFDKYAPRVGFSYFMNTKSIKNWIILYFLIAISKDLLYNLASTYHQWIDVVYKLYATLSLKIYWRIYFTK